MSLSPAKSEIQTAPRLAALALGAVALGALAIGALAIGGLAIGGMAVRKTKFCRIEIDELTARRLRVLESNAAHSADMERCAATEEG